MIEIKASFKTCRALGGAHSVRIVDDKEESFCGFEFCVQDKSKYKFCFDEPIFRI